MTFEEWLGTEDGQRALEYAESAPGAGLSMAWDAALDAAAAKVTDDAVDYWPSFDALRAFHK